MSGYKFIIIDDLKVNYATLLGIKDLNVQKRNWSINDTKIILKPIYATGRFDRYKNGGKRIPQWMQINRALEKVLELIIDNKIRYIETIINGYYIKFYTKNPKHYKFQYYFDFKKNIHPLGF